MRAAAVLLVAVLLAGCARDAPPPVTAGEPTFSDADVPMRGPPLLEWRELAQANVLVDAARPAELSAAVPEHAITVTVNLTLEQGAANGLRVEVSACQWARDQPFVAVGQTIAADCGGVGQGAHVARVAVGSGALGATARVMALVCVPGPETSPCPAPSPVAS